MLGSEDSDTLRGYDMVVSISEDAINKQFQYLWETPIPPKLVPKPVSLAGFEAPPRAKYYINHDISIHARQYRTYESLSAALRPKERPANGLIPFTLSDGIDGHILAPTVSFCAQGDKSRDFRSVRITLKFFRDETAPDGLKDSTITYFDKYLRIDCKAVINDCTVTWLANIGSADIENIMDDLVLASASPESTTLVPDKVVAKLKTVDSSKFLATSLFCLFESTKIVNSFEFFNPNLQKNPDGLTGDDPTLTEVVNGIATYFKQLSSQSDGKPTPDNPFVLGYGIVAKRSTSAQKAVDGLINTPYLVPKLFHLTVTGGDKVHTKGTLNYCILTHRSQGTPESSVDMKNDHGLGIFPQTLFETTSSNGTSGGADGIMAFSKRVFSDFWLHSQIAAKFKVNPGALSRYLVPDNDSIAQAPETESSTTLSNTSSQVSSIKTDFSYKPMKCKSMTVGDALENQIPQKLLDVVQKIAPDWGLYHQRRVANGSECVELYYSSDLVRGHALDWRDTAANRKIYLDLGIKTTLNIKLQTAGLSNLHKLFQDGGVYDKFKVGLEMVTDEDKTNQKLSTWRNAREANVKVKAKLGFDLTPTGSSWALTSSSDIKRSTFPTSGSPFDYEVLGPVDYSLEENLSSVHKKLPEPQRVTGDGMIIELANYEMFKQFGDELEMEKFKNVAAAWGNNLVQQIQAAVDALTEGLQNTLILPAGDVFEFKQLNTDPSGHAYTLITYKTPSRLEQVTP